MVHRAGSWLLLLLFLAPLPGSAERLLGVLAGTSGDPKAEDPGALIEVDLETGGETVIGVPVPGVGLVGIAARRDRRVFVATDRAKGPALLVEIDPDTGTTLMVIGVIHTDVREDPEEPEERAGTPPLSGEKPYAAVTLHDLAADPTTGLLYGIADHDQSERIDPDELFVIDPETAYATSAGVPDLGSNAPEGRSGQLAIAFTDTGELWGKEVNSSTLFRLDPATATVLSTIELDPPRGALGLGPAGDDGFWMSACCQPAGLTGGVANNASEIFHLDRLGNTTRLGTGASNRSFHDLALLGAPPSVVEIPTLGGFGSWSLASFLAASALVLARRRRSAERHGLLPREG